MPTLNRKSWQRLVTSLSIAALLSTAVPYTSLAQSSPLGEIYDTVSSQLRLTTTQVTNLMLVSKHATRSGHPEVIQALMLQESRAGENTNSNGNCHGALQVMTSTAIGVLRSDAEFRQKFFGVNKPTSKVVATKLKTDVVFSIEVVDRLLEEYLQKTPDINRVVLSFNRGERSLTSKQDPMKVQYVRDINKKLKQTIGPFNDIVRSIEDQDDTAMASI